MDIDAAAAPAALKANQVAGFAIAGAYPLPALLDLASATPIRLLGLAPPALGKALAADDSIAAETVPKGTYPGLDQDVTTLAVPGGRLHHDAHGHGDGLCDHQGVLVAARGARGAQPAVAGGEPRRHRGPRGAGCTAARCAITARRGVAVPAKLR